MRVFRGLLVLALWSGPLAAQCALTQLPGDGFCGANGEIAGSALWDPDGAGPAPVRVVLFGLFTEIGSERIAGIAAWDPGTRTFAGFGTAPSSVTAAIGLPNGDLAVAAGNAVWVWDGLDWSTLGSPFGGAVYAFTVLPDGDLVAGGNFTDAGGVPAVHVARWNGSAWSPIGAGIGHGSVQALATMPNGDLVAAGGFLTAFGVPGDNIARWDGAAWSPLGTGTAGAGGAAGGVIVALAVLPYGDLIAGGHFQSAGGTAANHVARWDGSNWHPLGAGVSTLPHWAAVYDVAALPNGDVVVGGDLLQAGGVYAERIARWDGTAWSALGSAGVESFTGTVRTLTALPDGTLVAGGAFPVAGGQDVQFAARWDGSAWAPLVDGFSTAPVDLEPMPDGSMVAVGAFQRAGDVEARLVARRVGNAWFPLGAGLTGLGAAAAAALPNGDLVVGGQLSMAGSVPVANVARWDGSAWHALGTGVDGPVTALLALPDGSVIAAGSFTTAGGTAAHNIARWDGTAWSALGDGLDRFSAAPMVHSLARMPNGDVVAAGLIDHSGPVLTPGIARWDGNAWAPLGAGIATEVSAIAVLPNGHIVAGRASSPATMWVAVWDGVAWTDHGPPGTFAGVRALAALPGGDLLVGGWRHDTTGAQWHVVRWNGSTWSPWSTWIHTHVHAFALDTAGDLFVAGCFGTSAGLQAVARFASTCPASAQSLGTGCPSSGGANVLTAATLPWVDSTFVGAGTGLPIDAFVVAVTGFGAIPQGQAPLGSVFPQAGIGCDVLVQPDIVDLLSTSTGTARSAVFLPNTPPLVGVTFHHQMVPVELDANGDLFELTATNALALTAGMF